MVVQAPSAEFMAASREDGVIEHFAGKNSARTPEFSVTIINKRTGRWNIEYVAFLNRSSRRQTRNLRVKEVLVGDSSG